MSSEPPDVYPSSFIRKSLAAVSKMGHPDPALAPVDVPTGIRKPPTFQSHRIFNLSLSRLRTSSASRLGSKAAKHAHKSPANLGRRVVDADESLDEDDSICHEQNLGVFHGPLKQFDDDNSDLELHDNLEADNSATDLSPTHGSAALPLPPPGLSPAKYPIIIPTHKHAVPQPGIVPPKHWAPGGSCNVRIEPALAKPALAKPATAKPAPAKTAPAILALPAMQFLPRPGTVPPSFWAPGGCVIRFEQPACSSVDQDDSDGTISNSTSAASLDDQGTADSPPDIKDHIQTQLERIFNMDDTDVSSEAALPGVSQSVWATCPTPPPSPNRPRPPMGRKRSHALLNYLLLECGYDLASLRRLEARLPVPRPDPRDIPDNGERHAPNLIDFDAEPTAENLQIQEATHPSAEDIESWNPLHQQSSQALDALAELEESFAMMSFNEEGDDRCEPTAVAQRSACTTAPEIAVPKPLVSWDRSLVKILLPYSKVVAARDGLDPVAYPLRRIRSLPENWRISAFTVFDKPTPPPSPTPAPKAKASKMYLQGAAISSVELLPAPPQSGHSYLQSLKLLKKPKTKTRNGGGTAQPEGAAKPEGVPLMWTSTGTLKKPSLMSRLRSRDNNVEEKPKAAPKPGGKWSQKLSTMSKTTAERMRVLVKCAPNARGGLSWKDFLKIMKELGFTCEEKYGDSYKFYPPDRSDPPISFLRPRENMWHIGKLTGVRKRLADTYGWSDEMLAALGAEN